MINENNNFKVKEWKLEELRGRKIWVPYMCDAAFILASVFRNLGYDSEVLPRSDDSLLSLGRKYTDGDQCIPSIITTEDILKRVFSEDFKEDKEAFFQGKSQGPCRFGRYYMNQQLILHELKLDSVPIFTLDNRDSYGGLGTEAKILAYDGILAQGLLERELHFIRPFEVNRGESQRVYEKYLKDISEIVEKGLSGNKKLKILTNKHKSELTSKLEEACNEFSKIERKEEEKPVVFVTGEIFVRSSSVANQNLIEKIESLGGVALLEPVISFFDYIHEKRMMSYKESISRGSFNGLSKFLRTKIDTYIARRDAGQIEEIFEFGLPHDPFANVTIKHGSKYVDSSYEGEAIVTLGSSDYFSSYVDGVINTMPFNCMPGMIVTSKTNEFREKNKNIPFLNLDYDGNFDAKRDERLEVFMYQVKEKNE